MMRPLLLLFLLVLVQKSTQHGFLLRPLSRNMHSFYYDPYDQKEYTPTQLSAGGAGVVSVGFTRQWPNGMWSPCGDAYSAPTFRWMAPRPIAGEHGAGK